MKRFVFMLFMVAPLFAQKNVEPPVSSAPNAYVIENPAYKLGFAANYGIPIWEMHNLEGTDLQKYIYSKEEWITDGRVKGYRLTPKDFDNIKLEIVQLFPQEHAGDNKEFKNSSFLISNLIFMNKQVKESVWDKITNSLNVLATQKKNAYLYAGPIFDKDSLKLKYILNNKVAIPSYFYRIALYFEGDKASYKCYRIPNRIPTDYERTCDISEFEYNIYQLEADTGIDFFDREIDSNFRQDKMKFLENQVK